MEHQPQQKSPAHTTPTNKSNKKNVSFAPTATLRLALHIDNYTEDEISASFYSKDEYSAFKQDAKRTVRMIEKKQKIDEIKTSRMGVDSLTRHALRLKLTHRRLALQAVLNKQKVGNQDLVESSGD